jgi:hypothetical protein
MASVHRLLLPGRVQGHADDAAAGCSRRYKKADTGAAQLWHAVSVMYMADAAFIAGWVVCKLGRWCTMWACLASGAVVGWRMFICRDVSAGGHCAEAVGMRAGRQAGGGLLLSPGCGPLAGRWSSGPGSVLHAF